MNACVIIDNMIVEDEGVVDPVDGFDYGVENVQSHHSSIDEFIKTHRRIMDIQTHHQLQDLIDHLQHHPDKY